MFFPGFSGFSSGEASPPKQRQTNPPSCARRRDVGLRGVPSNVPGRCWKLPCRSCRRRRRRARLERLLAGLVELGFWLVGLVWFGTRCWTLGTLKSDDGPVWLGDPLGSSSISGYCRSLESRFVFFYRFD